MFGRNKRRDDAEPAADSQQDAAQAPETKKGRPTPKRRESEQRNQHPIVADPVLPPNATKAERKAARKEYRKQQAENRARAQAGMNAGDERYLPKRDKGPVRRWARDYVDARHNIGDNLIVYVMVIFALSLIPKVANYATLLMVGLFAALLIDSLILGRAIKKKTTQRFGSQAKGAAFYGVMRSTQMRRMRIPAPKVSRGDYPR